MVHPKPVARQVGPGPGRCPRRHCASLPCPKPIGPSCSGAPPVPEGAVPAAIRRCVGPGPRPLQWVARAGRRCKNCAPSAADLVGRGWVLRMVLRQCAPPPGPAGRLPARRDRRPVGGASGPGAGASALAAAWVQVMGKAGLGLVARRPAPAPPGSELALPTAQPHLPPGAVALRQRRPGAVAGLPGLGACCLHHPRGQS